MDEKGVSPVVGTILLIAITVALAAVAAALVGGMGMRANPIVTRLVVEASAGSGVLVINHDGGDTIADAFVTYSSGLVGCWHFDENSGTTTSDSSGNGNDGAINGAAWTAGKCGSALRFDGSDDWVGCGNDESLNCLNFGTSDFTVEVWVKSDEDKAYSIVSKKDFSTSPGYALLSTVGTSTTASATQYPFQRKTFYASGRFWVWYSDGTNLIYRSSSDGSAWSGAASVGACSIGYSGSVFFDGTYVYYVRYASNILYYRRGTPNADGTITWSAGEQVVHSGAASDRYEFPMIAVDSGGYAWIGARHYDGTNYRPRVLKNANNDGTWSMAGGFPYTLSTTSSSAWRVSIVPLTSLKIYAIYSRDTVAGFGRLWGGSSWGAEETAISDAEYGYGHSAVVEGDDVHLVFLHDSLSTGIRYNKRTYGVGWGTETTVQASAASYMIPTLSIDAASGDLYCFWAGAPTAQGIYCKKCVGGTWDASPTMWLVGQATQTLGSGGDLDENFYGAIWKSQSFISLKNDNLWRVEIYAKRGTGTASVPITVRIYNADADGKPTGSPLYSGTIASFTSTTYAWRTHALSTPLSVIENQKYCIVVGAPTGSETNYYHWQVDSTSPPYADGNFAYSTDNGSTWTADTGKDALFRALFNSTLTGNDRLSCFYRVDNDKIGLLYMTRTASPYNVRFAYLTVAAFSPGWHLNTASSPPDLLFEVSDGSSRAWVRSYLGRKFDWAHVVGVKRGSAVEIWVNGELKHSGVAPSGSVNNTENLEFGRRSDGGYFKGTIDEVRIYDRALSPEEIKARYEVGEIKWKNLEIRINGKSLGTYAGDSAGTKDLKLNGSFPAAGTKNFSVGSTLTMYFIDNTRPRSGDEITIIYKPANQKLYGKRVP